MNTLFACPCCGQKTLPDQGQFDICPVCMWEDDPLQREDPTDAEGANLLCLSQYQAAYRAKSCPRPA